MTLQEHYGLWLSDHMTEIKPSTLARYKSIWNNQISKSPIASADITTITNRTIREFIIFLDGQGMMRSTMKNCVSFLLSLIKHYYVYNDMTVPRFSYTYPKSLSKPQKCKESNLLSIREQAVLVDYVINDTKESTHLAPIIAMFTGLRLGEVCGLQWKDIDFYRGSISVRQAIYDTCMDGHFKLLIQTPKTYSSIRQLPLNPDLARVLSKWRKEPEDYVLSGRNQPCIEGVVRRSFRNLCSKLGIKKVRFHALRHGFATTLLLQGADMTTVSSLMGHSSPAITMRIYAHTNDMARVAAMNAVTCGMLR